MKDTSISDSDRINWLEEHRPTSGWDIQDEGWWIDMDSPQFPTLRSAIDFAMTGDTGEFTDLLNDPAYEPSNQFPPPEMSNAENTNEPTID